METNAGGRWVQKFRALTLALIFSGTLNIGLLAAFAYSMLQEKFDALSVPLPVQAAAKEDATNAQIFAAMEKFSFRELVSFLTNKDLAEEGYAKRDLAIAALAAFHHFNVEKALSNAPVQRRTLALSDGRTIEVFPGLSDDHYEAIVRFAYQEKWPLTAKGLFAYLKKGAANDETLAQAFQVTPEFYALQILFQTTEAPQDPATLIRLASEGSWELLEQFTKEQAQMLDLSVDKRRRLLLSYLALQSPTAAQILLRTDFVFSLKKLDDQGILDLLSLLQNKTEESERFCVELLRSPRSDAIWQSAAIRLYGYVGETLSAPADPKETLARFAPSSPASPAPAPVRSAALAPAKPETRPEAKPDAHLVTLYHVVSEGESLWKIARRYKVKVDDLVSLNGIEKDRLYPGMTLKIPDRNPDRSQGTGSEPPR